MYEYYIVEKEDINETFFRYDTEVERNPIEVLNGRWWYLPLQVNSLTRFEDGVRWVSRDVFWREYEELF